MNIQGILVLPDRVVAGTLEIDDGVIVAIEPSTRPKGLERPFIAPGFVDVHVHGWGGHDAMAGSAALTGMARGLARRGVTSFLPSGVSAPLPVLHTFADSVRSWTPGAPSDGARPLGFNLEGPFLADARRGAHDSAHLVDPATVGEGDLAPLLEDLRLITIAPERPGALDLIHQLSGRGVAVALGHSAATAAEARAGYAAGARNTTHLFNGMTGVDHRAPGVATAALLEDAAWVELIADGHHVHLDVWPLIWRAKPADRLILVSDAITLAGTSATRARIGGLDVELADGRVTLAGTTTLAGSVIALDDAVRNLVTSGVPLHQAAAAASAHPLALLGETDRGRLAVGQVADLVELDQELRVLRVMREGRWLD